MGTREELAIDVEYAHAMAPGSHLIVWLLPIDSTGAPDNSANPNTNYQEAVHETAQAGVKIVSNSWGNASLPSQQADPSSKVLPEYYRDIETTLQAAASAGTTFLFDSGDYGAYSGCRDGGKPQTCPQHDFDAVPMPAFPAESQYVVAVGGTRLTRDSHVVPPFDETAWGQDDQQQSSGGGCSVYEAHRPFWQRGTAAAHCQGRAVPDVAAFARGSNVDAYVVYDGADHTNGGGTSLATPLWAGIAADLARYLELHHKSATGFMAPGLYRLATNHRTGPRDFHDITRYFDPSKTNGFPVGKGWDEVTGWGSPDLAHLEEDWATTDGGLHFPTPTQPRAPARTPVPAVMGSWTHTSDMSTPREYHTATLLPDGKVLVVGGCKKPRPPTICGFGLGSAELYDPVTGTWTSAGSMKFSNEDVGPGRLDFSATLLANGKVLIAGGLNFSGARYETGALYSAELYDPSTNSWTLTGSMHSFRFGASAVLLRNGKVLVVGGGDDLGHSYNSAEIYDPKTGTWTPTGSMVRVLSSAPATLLPKGQVLVVGGGGDEAKLTAELYDPTMGKWTLTGPIANLYNGFMATLLSNGRILVTGTSHNGGAAAELYNPSTKSWTDTGSMATVPEGVRGGTATLLANGEVLVVGGCKDVLCSLTMASAELYNPRTGTWTPASSMTTARAYHTATLLPDGHVLVAGGADNSHILASAEVYQNLVKDTPSPSP